MSIKDNEDEDDWANFQTCPDGFCVSCWACRGDCEEAGGPYPRDDGIATPAEWELRGRPEKEGA